ncbi:CopG family transcriptional regulator [Gammaproteobacteria bacterium]
MSITIQAEVPDILWQKAQFFVQHGWANDMQQLISEALRRYLESHQEAITERFIMEDVEWGLHEQD